jgi:hypothetical protein
MASGSVMKAVGVLGVLMVTTATAAPAAADSYAPDEGRRRDPDAALQLEGGTGFVVGEQPVGTIVGTAFGFHVDGGVRRGRIAALAEYWFTTLTEDSSDELPTHAYVHRVGGVVRYSFGVLRTDDYMLRGDFWVEAGVGRQLVQWRDGGTLGRTDAALGLAGQIQIRYGREQRRKLGLFYAARFLFADRPGDKLLPEACGGPCDEPSRAIPVDIGIYFNLGVVFR